MSQRFSDQHPQYFANGSPASNGSLEFFDAGTTGESNRRDTYSDEALTIANPNPTNLDSNGRSSFDIYLDGSYQVIVRDKNGVQLDSIDNVVGVGTATTTGVLPPIRESHTATANQVLFSLATSYTLGINSISAYRNGVFITNFSETSTSSITFDTPAVADDSYLFEIRAVNDNSSSMASNLVTYSPSGTGSVDTNVKAQLDTVSAYFNTNALMVSDCVEPEGRIVITKGGAAIGDGDGRKYLIVAGSTGTEDGFEFIDLDSGRQAQLVADAVSVLIDGITAPSAIVGFAQIYVDVADGDLKVIFGDGHVAVIAADS